MNTKQDLSHKLLGGVLTLVGLGVLIFAIFDYYEAKSSTSWENTIGKILESTIESHRNDDGITYKPVIVYSYKVNKKRYHSRVVYFGESLHHSSIKVPQDLVNRFPIGSEVKVYYNPKSPSNSILLAGVTNDNYINIFIGFALMVGGIFVVKNKLDKEKV